MQNLQKKQNKKRKGFTLVELIIVVVIIGILVGLGAMLYGSATGDAQRNVVRSNMKTMESAIRVFQVEHGGTYPADQAALEALVSPDTFAQPSANYTYTAPVVDAGGNVTTPGTIVFNDAGIGIVGITLNIE